MKIFKMAQFYKDGLNKQFIRTVREAELILVAEDHGAAENIKLMSDLIKYTETDRLLQEHTGYRNVMNKSEAFMWKYNIEKRTPNHQYPFNRYTPKWIDFAVKNNIKLIGIDYKPLKIGYKEYLKVVDELNLKTSFLLREKRMIDVIKKELNKSNTTVIASIGGEHLRTKITKEYGRSTIYNEFKNNNDAIMVTF